MQERKKAVIIVSGGSGSRMGGEIPKQYLVVNRKPVLVWTIEKFLNYDPGIQIVLVLGEEHDVYWDDIYRNYFEKKAGFKHETMVIAQGGTMRFDSVRNGLKRVDPGCIVGIHDAVRPMVSKETITRCFKAAAKFGSAIPVIDVEDTIRSGDKMKSSQLDRGQLKRVQTPQVFLAEQIKEAYSQPFRIEFTDDASVYEAMFGKVMLVEGNPENLKITKPPDLRIASVFLN